MKTFQCLKVGDSVCDKGYGPGTVLAKTKTRCCIQLACQSRPWNYDTAHVNAFIVLTSTKSSTARKHSRKRKSVKKSNRH